LLCELDAVVGQNGVDLIGHGFEHVLQELPCGLPVCLLDELGHGKLACSVNIHEQVELDFSSLNLGNIDVEEAPLGRFALQIACWAVDGVAFELLTLWLVTFHIRQPRNAMTLQTSMQRRTRQMRDRRLQSIKTMVQW